jgi:integrase
MNRLQDTDLHSERLDKIRDLAVFQAGSGLAYADLYLLVPEDILTSPEGIKYIYKERQKTGVFFTSVLLPCAISVLNKYNNMLPIVSNQRYNSYLKEIQTLCRIEKTLHTHLFRKTYATYLLNSGCRMDVVAQAMGHTSTRITAATYAFMQKNTVVTEIGNIMLL